MSVRRGTRKEGGSSVEMQTLKRDLNTFHGKGWERSPRWGCSSQGGKNNARRCPARSQGPERGKEAAGGRKPTLEKEKAATFAFPYILCQEVRVLCVPQSSFWKKTTSGEKSEHGRVLGKSKSLIMSMNPGQSHLMNNNKYSVSISNTTHTHLIYAFDDEMFRSSSQQPRMLNPTSRLSSPHFTDEKREAQKSHLHKTANLAKFNTEVHKKKLMTLWSSV